MGANHPREARVVKVLVVFGTRPEAIKMAPVVRELKRSGDCHAVVCATAQHRDMLDQVLDVFDIAPDYDLDLMRPDQTLASITARAIAALDEVVERERPDWLLVQGDTTTAMVGALAGFYRHVRVGHVEAGLRTGDKSQPFPEEVNRRIADVVSDWHFAPTTKNREALLREGYHDRSILVTGNTVIDALETVVAEVRDCPAVTAELGLDDRRVLLVTAHRRENFGAPLQEICQALLDIARRYPSDVQIVFPVHPNPNVQRTVRATLGAVENVRLTDPLGYRELVAVMDRAYLLLTDSGGLQEEAPGLGKPVLVLRDVTERPEGVDAGAVRLVGTSKQRIVHETSLLLNDPRQYALMAQAVNPYGDGRASQRIVSALLGREVTPFVPSRS